MREARLAAKLSQEELGRQIRLERTMVAKIEAGTRRIDAVELVRLGSCLDLPLSHFLYDRPAVLSRRAALHEEEATGAGRESFQLEAALVSWLRDVRQMQALGVLDAHPVVTYDRKVDSEVVAREAAVWLRSQMDSRDEPIPSGALSPGEATIWLPNTPTKAELLDATGWTPQPDLEWVRVPPSYAHAVLHARQQRLITTARAVELMRGQIVETDLPLLGDEDMEP